MARAKKKIAIEVAEEAVLSQAEALEKNKELDAPSLSIEATKEIIEAVNELRRLEELKKRLVEIEEAHRLKIMNFMGMHQQLKTGYFTLASWKAQTRKSFNSSAFKVEFSDLYSSYLKEINIRVFRLC